MAKKNIKNDKQHIIRIMGLDPGTAMTGWGIIAVEQKEPKLEVYGCIKTCKTKCTVDRLKEIAANLQKLIKTYQPDEIAVEEIFFFKNLKTAIQVAQARGVLLYISGQACIPISEYTPLQVKQALTGYGKAEKQQVQYMVKSILKLPSIPRPDDAADALAVAVCHQQSRSYPQSHNMLSNS